jgi:hypothetical protein
MKYRKIHHLPSVQTSYEAYPASNPMGKEVFSSGVNAAGA